jgi:RNA polymerase sigma factor (sigma-70 family)
MPSEDLNTLLAELASGRAAEAWRLFVRRYSGLLYRVVRRFEARDDRRGECFLFVCNALSDDSFARLQKFKSDGPARFDTWLMTIAGHLCIDWQRRQDGRVRAPVSVRSLSALEQAVFGEIFVRGSSRRDCLERLRKCYPELTEPLLSEINAKLFRTLSPRLRFFLSARLGMKGPVAASGLCDGVDDVLGIGEPPLNPETVAHEAQESARLAVALARLEPRDRLLLNLRFEQGLTLAEIARVCQIPDPFRARRQIEAALQSLKTCYEAANASETPPQTAPECP